jgi:hypothetical protein
MDNWVLADMPAAKAVPLAEAAPKMAAFVEYNRVTDAVDAPHPEGGYWLLARGSEVAREHGGPDDINLTVKAGSEGNNDVEFEVGRLDLPNDLSIITYPLFRNAFEILMERGLALGVLPTTLETIPRRPRSTKATPSISPGLATFRQPWPSGLNRRLNSSASARPAVV